MKLRICPNLHKWQSWDSNPCQRLHSSPLDLGEGFAFHRKTFDLSLAGNEEARKGGHAVFALKHLTFREEKQARAKAFRVCTGHDKCWTTGIDKEACLPHLCSKMRAS